MDADPTPEQGPSGVDTGTPMVTDNQQTTEMLPGSTGDSGVTTPVENVAAGQDNCQSISDVAQLQEDNVDSGSKADNNVELHTEDKNVRLKIINFIYIIFICIELEWLNRAIIYFFLLLVMAPVVQRSENAIQQINHYPVDSLVCFFPRLIYWIVIYPVDSVIHPWNN